MRKANFSALSLEAWGVTFSTHTNFQIGEGEPCPSLKSESHPASETNLNRYSVRFSFYLV